MAALSGRVARLERRAGVRGVCPACEGRGAPGFEVWLDGERQGPERRGCQLCGRLGLLYRLGIDDPEEGTEEPVGTGGPS